MNRVYWPTFFMLCCFLLFSCDDNLRTMSLDKFYEGVFDFHFDGKRDTIIYEYRNFFGDENRGESAIIVKLQSEKALAFVQHIKWLTCTRETIDTTHYKYREMDQANPVSFDQEKQIVQIAYSKVESRSINFKELLKGVKLNDLYYQIESRKTEFGFLERRVFLFDKNEKILYLSFSNM